MIFEAFQFAGAWLVYDTAEHTLNNFIVGVMPNYSRQLHERGLLRTYTSAAPSLINSVACTAWSLISIALGEYTIPYFSFAYFAYDTARGCTREMMIHHGIAAFLISISTHDESTSTVAPHVLLTECSTIFLNMLVILCGPTKSSQRLNLTASEMRTKSALKTLFASSFILTRMGVLPFAMHWIWNKNKYTFAALLPLQLLNVYWFLKLVKPKSN